MSEIFLPLLGLVNDFEESSNAVINMVSNVSFMMALIQKQIAEAIQCINANRANLLDLLTINVMS